jgi:hypothetical protein
MLNHLWIGPLMALVVLLPGASPAPPESVQDPVVWSQVVDDGVVLALHTDGVFTASKLSEGELVTSTTAPPPQGTGTAPTPTLTTTYTGVDNMVHTITTPVVSTTEGGLAAAIQTHKALVALMKAHYPPHL